MVINLKYIYTNNYSNNLENIIKNNLNEEQLNSIFNKFSFTSIPFSYMLPR